MNEMVQLCFDELKEGVDKAINYLKSEMGTIKAGRANPHILHKIRVDYYGTPTPIDQMAGVSVPEARLLQISPWDTSMLKTICKAIIDSDIGITPNDDGKVIRLVFPALTEERRRDIVKQVRKLGEDAKIGIRNARQECNDELKKLEKEKQISADELESFRDRVQKIVDQKVAEVDVLLAEKEKEVMTV